MTNPLSVGGGIVLMASSPALCVKRLHPDAIIPKYQTAGAACFDLHCISGGTLPGFQSLTFMTGLAYEVPIGFVMMIYSRSGHGFKSGVRLANTTGVIDSDFRGEIVVRLKNDSPGSLDINSGDRIAQAMLIPVQRWNFLEVDDLSETARGTNGFGSTGS